jgi:hypothetical protein
MHCAEVAPSIALVVLSEGQNSQLSDLMHTALNSLQRIQVLGNSFQRRQRSQDIASEIPDKVTFYVPQRQQRVGSCMWFYGASHRFTHMR